MADVYAELVRLVRAFDAANIDYAICGALALAAHGFPRATKDIDLLARPEDAERIRELLLSGLSFSKKLSLGGRKELGGARLFQSIVYLGRIDAISGGRLYGWAWDRVRPSDHLEVEIRVGDKLVATAFANQPRDDLKANGVGDGCHVTRDR